MNIIILLFGHFIADFVFQTHKQAVGKSVDFMLLTAHVCTYTLGMFITALFVFPTWQDAFGWACLNGILHLTTDFATSKINASLWKKGDAHNFFVGVGADQFVHQACIILTYNFAINGS
jgi:hypothetical protein